MVTVKRRQVPVALAQEDREVCANHYLQLLLTRGGDESPQVRGHLRGAPRDMADLKTEKEVYAWLLRLLVRRLGRHLEVSPPERPEPRDLAGVDQPLVAPD